jgi:hypothetical protein
MPPPTVNRAERRPLDVSYHALVRALERGIPLEVVERLAAGRQVVAFRDHERILLCADGGAYVARIRRCEQIATLLTRTPEDQTRLCRERFGTEWCSPVHAGPVVPTLGGDVCRCFVCNEVVAVRSERRARGAA